MVSGTTPGVTGVPFLDPQLNPSGKLDSVIAQAQMVSRPDLVRVDQAGNVSEIATVIVNGKIFEDWETVWIRWSWAEPFSIFRFTCAEREPYPLPGAVLQFAPGQEVEIYLGGIQVINGMIITRQVAYDANSHMVQLQGVSSSWSANRSGIDHKDSDFDGKSFIEIASEILEPTGVGFSVVGTIDPKPFKAGATPTTGMTIGQFLETLARDRKVIISNLPNGDFLFVGQHTWPSMGDLVEGVNIKKCQCVISSDAAWSEYITRAQSKGDDTQWGKQVSEQEARLKGLLGRYSVLITAIEHPVWSKAEVETRNETEKMWNEDINTINCDITVYGWFRPTPSAVDSFATQIVHGLSGHSLWQAGDEVVVHSPMAMLYHQPLKIKTVTWTQDSRNGSQTLLNLTTPRGLNSDIPIPLGKSAAEQLAAGEIPL